MKFREVVDAYRRAPLRRRLGASILAVGLYAIILALVGTWFEFQSKPSGASSDGSWPLLVVTASAVLTGLTGFAFGRSQGRREVGSLRLAVGGSPGAGKTVYVNVLMNALMDGLDPRLRFTPETKTALSVVRASRRLSANEWPTATDEQGIYRYSGVLDSHASVVRRFLGLESSVRLEIADSAGELWLQLSTEGSMNREREEVEHLPLSESSFFEYVTNAHSLCYFIGADQLLGDPQRLRIVVDDAISAVHLLTATRGPRRRRPINFVLVISKSDLLTANQAELIELLVSGREEFSILSAQFQIESSGGEIDADFMDSLLLIERLVSVLGRRVDAYVGFVISSVAAAMESRLIDESFVNRNIDTGSFLLDRRQAVRRRRGPEADVLSAVRWSLLRYWDAPRGRRGTA